MFLRYTIVTKSCTKQTVGVSKNRPAPRGESGAAWRLLFRPLATFRIVRGHEGTSPGCHNVDLQSRYCGVWQIKLAEYSYKHHINVVGEGDSLVGEKGHENGSPRNRYGGRVLAWACG